MSNIGLSKKYEFKKAVPVWEKDTQKEKNRSLIFRWVLSGKEESLIKIAAHSRYQIFVNGSFFAAGPARAAHGYYRVSEYTLKDNLTDNENIITVIAAGYNVNSYYLLDEPSFLCMEIERNGEVIFATDKNNTNAYNYTNRLIKTPRYSFQRPFTECYVFDKEFDAYTKDPQINLNKAELEETEDKNFITRNVPYCSYTQIKAQKIVSKGILVPDKNRRHFTDISLKKINEKLKGFIESELEASPAEELYAYCPDEIITNENDITDISLNSKAFCLYDMGKNNTGYIRLSFKAEKDTTVYASFNEILADGVFADPGKDNCENVIKWSIKGGRTYDVVSFEPYTFRYIQIISLCAPITVTNVSVFEECYPKNLLSGIKKMPDKNLQLIYDAAVETFRQNATDIFMDCPSRERAGWLCDSYFTAFAERELTGNSIVERNFIENFLLPDSFDFIPNGMLPMCYPADHNDGIYIHNWAFWFVLELKNYIEATGDTVIKEKARQRVFELLEFTKKYENQDGLLQNIDSWIFVEWSKANDFVRDISYPSNMLYALVLDTVAELYADISLHQKAEKLRKTIVEKSFNGEFFTDNAVLDENSVAQKTNNITETCQYYAFFTKTATKEAFPKLYDTLINDFGPKRNICNKYPDIHFSNAFIGNYLRLFILLKNNNSDILLKEIEDFFLPMAEKTGTLWENMTDSASCCHGFCSVLTYILAKALNLN